MRALNANGLPARIVDYLETFGVWATTDELALHLKSQPVTVERALYRLRNRGLIESRQVWLDERRPRNEWRAA